MKWNGREVDRDGETNSAFRRYFQCMMVWTISLLDDCEVAALVSHMIVLFFFCDVMCFCYMLR